MRGLKPQPRRLLPCSTVPQGGRLAREGAVSLGEPRSSAAVSSQADTPGCLATQHDFRKRRGLLEDGVNRFNPSIQQALLFLPELPTSELEVVTLPYLLSAQLNETSPKHHKKLTWAALPSS